MPTVLCKHCEHIWKNFKNERVPVAMPTSEVQEALIDRYYMLELHQFFEILNFQVCVSQNALQDFGVKCF